MSSGARIPLADAQKDADDFRAMFAGDYDQWVIAGSIRRRRPDVGDVEHVVVSRTGSVRPPGSMFPEDGSLVHDRLDRLVAERVLTRATYPDGRTRWGERLRGVMFRGRRHELFFAAPQNFYAILVIRTGSAEFSQRLVTQMRASGLYQQGSDKKPGFVLSQRDGSVRAVASEQDYFGLCGEPWTEPEDRNE